MQGWRLSEYLRSVPASARLVTVAQPRMRNLRPLFVGMHRLGWPFGAEAMRAPKFNDAFTVEFISLIWPLLTTTLARS